MADCSHGQLGSLTRLSSCNPKLVWRGGKGLTITSAVGGGLRSLRSVREETEKPSAPPKTTSSSLSPLSCVFFWTVCPWLYLITPHLTVHLCSCMCKQCLFLQCLWDCVILGSLFPLEVPKRLNWFLVLLCIVVPIQLSRFHLWLLDIGKTSFNDTDCKGLSLSCILKLDHLFVYCMLLFRHRNWVFSCR